ncbi:MAG: DUF7718 family protein [Thermomicrobiales bacterium]
MPPPDWDINLDEESVIRVRVTMDRRSQILVFTAQLECYIGEVWRPIVRYDTAHGQAHIDLLNPKGVEYEKIWLGFFEPYNIAFTRAIDELKETYREHKARYLSQMEKLK